MRGGGKKNPSKKDETEFSAANPMNAVTATPAGGAGQGLANKPRRGAKAAQPTASVVGSQVTPKTMEAFQATGLRDVKMTAAGRGRGRGKAASVTVSSRGGIAQGPGVLAAPSSVRRRRSAFPPLRVGEVPQPSMQQVDARATSSAPGGNRLGGMGAGGGAGGGEDNPHVAIAMDGAGAKPQPKRGRSFRAAATAVAAAVGGSTRRLPLALKRAPLQKIKSRRPYWHSRYIGLDPARPTLMKVLDNHDGIEHPLRIMFLRNLLPFLLLAGVGCCAGVLYDRGVYADWMSAMEDHLPLSMVTSGEKERDQLLMAAISVGAVALFFYMVLAPVRHFGVWLISRHSLDEAYKDAFDWLGYQDGMEDAHVHAQLHVEWLSSNGYPKPAAHLLNSMLLHEARLKMGGDQSSDSESASDESNESDEDDKDDNAGPVMGGAGARVVMLPLSTPLLVNRKTSRPPKRPSRSDGDSGSDDDDDDDDDDDTTSDSHSDEETVTLATDHANLRSTVAKALSEWTMHLERPQQLSAATKAAEKQFSTDQCQAILSQISQRCLPVQDSVFTKDISRVNPSDKMALQARLRAVLAQLGTEGGALNVFNTEIENPTRLYQLFLHIDHQLGKALGYQIALVKRCHYLAACIVVAEGDEQAALLQEIRYWIGRCEWSRQLAPEVPAVTPYMQDTIRVFLAALVQIERIDKAAVIFKRGVQTQVNSYRRADEGSASSATRVPWQLVYGFYEMLRQTSMGMERTPYQAPTQPTKSVTPSRKSPLKASRSFRRLSADDNPRAVSVVPPTAEAIALAQKKALESESDIMDIVEHQQEQGTASAAAEPVSDKLLETVRFTSFSARQMSGLSNFFNVVCFSLAAKAKRERDNAVAAHGCIKTWSCLASVFMLFSQQPQDRLQAMWEVLLSKENAKQQGRLLISAWARNMAVWLQDFPTDQRVRDFIYATSPGAKINVAFKPLWDFFEATGKSVRTIDQWFQQYVVLNSRGKIQRIDKAKLVTAFLRELNHGVREQEEIAFARLSLPAQYQLMVALLMRQLSRYSSLLLAKHFFWSSALSVSRRMALLERVAEVDLPALRQPFFALFYQLSGRQQEQRDALLKAHPGRVAILLAGLHEPMQTPRQSRVRRMSLAPSATPEREQSSDATTYAAALSASCFWSPALSAAHRVAMMAAVAEQVKVATIREAMLAAWLAVEHVPVHTALSLDFLIPLLTGQNDADRGRAITFIATLYEGQSVENIHWNNWRESLLSLVQALTDAQRRTFFNRLDQTLGLTSKVYGLSLSVQVVCCLSTRFNERKADLLMMNIKEGLLGALLSVKHVSNKEALSSNVVGLLSRLQANIHFVRPEDKLTLLLGDKLPYSTARQSPLHTRDAPTHVYASVRTLLVAAKKKRKQALSHEANCWRLVLQFSRSQGEAGKTVLQVVSNQLALIRREVITQFTDNQKVIDKERAAMQRVVAIALRECVVMGHVTAAEFLKALDPIYPLAALFDLQETLNKVAGYDGGKPPEADEAWHWATRFCTEAQEKVAGEGAREGAREAGRRAFKGIVRGYACNADSLGANAARVLDYTHTLLKRFGNGRPWDTDYLLGMVSGFPPVDWARRSRDPKFWCSVMGMIAVQLNHAHRTMQEASQPMSAYLLWVLWHWRRICSDVFHAADPSNMDSLLTEVADLSHLSKGQLAKWMLHPVLLTEDCAPREGDVIAAPSMPDSDSDDEAGARDEKPDASHLAGALARSNSVSRAHSVGRGRSSFQRGPGAGVARSASDVGRASAVQRPASVRATERANKGAALAGALQRSHSAERSRLESSGSVRDVSARRERSASMDAGKTLEKPAQQTTKKTGASKNRWRLAAGLMSVITRSSEEVPAVVKMNPMGLTAILEEDESRQAAKEQRASSAAVGAEGAGAPVGGAGSDAVLPPKAEPSLELNPAHAQVIPILVASGNVVQLFMVLKRYWQSFRPALAFDLHETFNAMQVPSALQKKALALLIKQIRESKSYGEENKAQHWPWAMAIREAGVVLDARRSLGIDALIDDTKAAIARQAIVAHMKAMHEEDSLKKAFSSLSADKTIHYQQMAVRRTFANTLLWLSDKRVKAECLLDSFSLVAFVWAALSRPGLLHLPTLMQEMGINQASSVPLLLKEWKNALLDSDTPLPDSTRGPWLLHLHDWLSARSDRDVDNYRKSLLASFSKERMLGVFDALYASNKEVAKGFMRQLAMLCHASKQCGLLTQLMAHCWEKYRADYPAEDSVRWLGVMGFNEGIKPALLTDVMTELLDKRHTNEIKEKAMRRMMRDVWRAPLPLRRVVHQALMSACDQMTADWDNKTGLLYFVAALFVEPDVAGTGHMSYQHVHLSLPAAGPGCNPWFARVAVLSVVVESLLHPLLLDFVAPSTDLADKKVRANSALLVVLDEFFGRAAVTQQSGTFRRDVQALLRLLGLSHLNKGVEGLSFSMLSGLSHLERLSSITVHDFEKQERRGRRDSLLENRNKGEVTQRNCAAVGPYYPWIIAHLSVAQVLSALSLYPHFTLFMRAAQEGFAPNKIVDVSTGKTLVTLVLLTLYKRGGGVLPEKMKGGHYRSLVASPLGIPDETLKAMCEVMALAASRGKGELNDVAAIAQLTAFCKPACKTQAQSTMMQAGSPGPVHACLKALGLADEQPIFDHIWSVAKTPKGQAVIRQHGAAAATGVLMTPLGGAGGGLFATRGSAGGSADTEVTHSSSVHPALKFAASRPGQNMFNNAGLLALGDRSEYVVSDRSAASGAADSIESRMPTGAEVDSLASKPPAVLSESVLTEKLRNREFSITSEMLQSYLHRTARYKESGYVDEIAKALHVRPLERSKFLNWCATSPDNVSTDLGKKIKDKLDELATATATTPLLAGRK